MSGHSSHTAFEATRLFNWQSNAPFDITSLESFGDKQLCIGGSNGSFLQYQVNVASSRQPLELKRTLPNFVGKKPITQIQAICDFDLLVTLSDYHIYLNHLASLKPKPTPILKKDGKNLSQCSRFYIEMQRVDMPGRSVNSRQRRGRPPEHYNLWLLAVCKNRIQIFRFADDDFVHHKTLDCPANPKTIAWVGTQVLVGFSERITLIDVNTSNPTNFIDNLKKSDPVVCRLSPTETLLSYEIAESGRGTAKRSSFMDNRGRVSRSFAISWPHKIPLAAAQDDPYILALNDEGLHIVYAHDKSIHVQRIDTPRACFLTNGCGIFLASNRSCWHVTPRDLSEQVSELERIGNYDFAVKLAEFITDDQEKEARLMNIRQKLACSQFNEKKFAEALQLFQQLNTDPKAVIGLHPWLLRGFFDPSAFKPLGPVPQLSEEDKLRATAALCDYLKTVRTGFREKSARGMVQEEQDALETSWELVDSLLLICYLKVSPEKVNDFISRPDNKISLELCKVALERFKKPEQLVRFYRARKHHEMALQLLIKLAGSHLKEDRHYQQILEYLSQIEAGNTELILKYAKLLLNEDVPETEVLFLFHSESNQSFDTKMVFEFLQKIREEVAISYLEQHIESGICDDPDMHTTLAKTYLKSLENAVKQYGGFSESTSTKTPISNMLNAKREKLFSFLNWSSQYKPNRLLSYFSQGTPLFTMFRERALLLGRVKRHKQALQVLVYDLGDIEAAERHCDMHYNKDLEHDRDVYSNLIEVCLNPPASQPPRTDFALKLLSRHHDKVDATKVLNLLPSSTPIHKLRQFLASILEKKATEARHARVVKNLVRAENVQVHNELLKKQDVAFHFSERPGSKGRCCVCGDMVRTGAFAIFPAGVVTHFNCMIDEYTCPLPSKECSCRLKHIK